MIRPARPDDVPVMVQLVRDLADYERAIDQVQLTEAMLAEALFREGPKVHALVADVSAEIVGMAVWFVTYSTWTGQHGIYLEDLFVLPRARGLGLGRALLSRLAGVAVEMGYPRLEWSVLDWNEPAIGFYHRLGAEPLEDWTRYRLSGPALTGLSAAEPESSAPD